MATKVKNGRSALATSPPVEHPCIDRVPGICGGRPKIRGHRIPVWTIASWHKMDMTVSDMLEMYPQLTAAQIHDALSYYQAHRDEVDREIAENTEVVMRAGFDAR